MATSPSLEDNKLPPALLKVYLMLPLQGLNYLHSECHIIHTGQVQLVLGVKESPGSRFDRSEAGQYFSGIQESIRARGVVEKQTQNPIPRKIKDDLMIYLSHK